ncbi:hypothetical protein Nepgr_003238 [Nepenthes gracilis]|uniref:Uncharacterized protein n=1 Tax=Nepenthes gracilis TaxID=150966 RepID=A0AAD3RZ88_NEPGR|nr:hypothetical protein Nepgr_003238 [Nepenthes gracilis]
MDNSFSSDRDAEITEGEEKRASLAQLGHLGLGNLAKSCPPVAQVAPEKLGTWVVVEAAGADHETMEAWAAAVAAAAWWR